MITFLRWKPQAANTADLFFFLEVVAVENEMRRARGYVVPMYADFDFLYVVNHAVVVLEPKRHGL
jgi:hypothetical protein